MADNMPNKTAMADNQLTRELMVVREKMRDRLMIEGNKPYYKNQSNRWTLIGGFSLWLGYMIYNTIKGTTMHSSFHD